MASQENKENSTSSSQVEPDTSSKPLEEEVTSKQEPESTKEKAEAEENSNDDNDVDLSAVEVASSLLDQTFGLDDPEFNIPDTNNEAYKSIMGICSSTTENIKKSIYEILNSREKVDISEDDPTVELQQSLNKKMEDFKKVISGCLDSDSTQAASSTSGNTEQQSAEVELEEKESCADEPKAELEEKERCADEPKADSSKSVDSETVIEEVAEKSPSPSSPVDLNAEEQSKKDAVPTPKNKTNKNKAAKDKAKNANLNNSNTDAGVIVADTTEKTNAKVSKTSEKKSDTVFDPNSFLTKPLASSLLEVREQIKNAITQDEEKLAKKQKNGTSKKKGEKSMDQILKSLGNGTAEEKLQILCKKYAESLEEYRLVEPRLKQMERTIVSQQREKEVTQAELNRMILAKSRLEGLCREMQRQSKAVKEESLLRIREEEEKRKEVANKFQATLNDISSLMQENSKKNIQLRGENAELATKLKGLVDNYEIWEQNMSKVVQQKELEAQLAKAKHAKVNLLLKQETEKFLREKQSLLENLSELQKRCTVLTSNELQLRTELSDYTSKYEEFQSVLSNSSKVFSTFKNDMESTSKKIKKLEKETNVYKQKWESSNKALVDMISHKEKQDKDFSNAQQRILTLEKLCRALQAERNELQNQIDVFSSNSVPSKTPEVPSLAAEAGVV